MRMSALANPPTDKLVRSQSLYARHHRRVLHPHVHRESRVRIGRTSRGMTQQDLSGLLDVDCDNLASYEAGGERINAKLLLQIAKLLDVRPDYFFRGYVEVNLKAL